MSLSNKIFRASTSKNYTNGPRLEFTTQPTPLSVDTGSDVTIATEAFPFFGGTDVAGIATGFGVAGGALVYKWYKDEQPLVDGTGISGAGTSTITLSSVESVEDSGEYKCRVLYIPGSPSLERRYRTAGKAINSPLDSTTVSLKVYPTVTITTQPVNTSVADGEEATFTAAASVSNNAYNLQYYWEVDGTEVANSNSTSLTLTKSGTTTQSVQFFAFVTRDDNTRITASSNQVDFIGVSPRSILQFEAFDASNNYSTSEQNLDDSDFTLTSATFGSDYSVVQFSAKEKDFDLKMDIRASRGANNGSVIGGEGGTSTVTLSVVEDTEYTVLGVSNNSAVYIYQGSQLLLVVGQGGNAGTTGQGGDGGGVNRSGSTGGGGANAGTGGSLISSGNLSLSGQWGSILSGASFTIQSGDSIALLPNGGQTVSCSKGQYWLDQAVAACANNSSSEIKYRGTDGTEVSGSEELTRGFKPGYTVGTTAGGGINNGGNGGNGASGGAGGNNGAGGGGGSGYTNGTVTVDASTSGGNSFATSSIRFYV